MDSPTAATINKNSIHQKMDAIFMAERVGFEPTVGCPITSFQD